MKDFFDGTVAEWRFSVILSGAKNLFSTGFFVVPLLPGPHVTRAGAGRMTQIDISQQRLDAN